MINVFTNDLLFYNGIAQLLKPAGAKVHHSVTDNIEPTSLSHKISLVIIDMHGLLYNFEEMLTTVKVLTEKYPYAKLMIVANRINKITKNTLHKFNKTISVVTAESFYNYCITSFSQKNKFTTKNLLSTEQTALTKREIQVLKYVATGKSLKKISRVTNLNEKTISFYKCSIMRKYGCTNMVEFKMLMEELGYRSF
ncbi:helix-turn-helix transcriptional regulator [Enterobacter quasiroggenkampii]|uniref:helix-turn-helix transcriptional regulator n=1 Tax=Enterobacter quasiroggenkampii TaxID=2497436 RepID=UPI001F29D54B|nr:LuxR C-terminal-related transcriptional regulator [Enterobacter quasiroggenkampii]